jgi:hypothetical protein
LISLLIFGFVTFKIGSLFVSPWAKLLAIDYLSFQHCKKCISFFIPLFFGFQTQDILSGLNRFVILFKVFILCVVCVLITMVLNIDIGTMCFMNLDCCIVASEIHFNLNVLYVC